MNTMLNVRMNDEMLSRAGSVAKELGYLSVQEYVREAVRQDIERHYRLKAELDAIVTSARHVKPRRLTIEERNRLAREPLSSKEKAMLSKWEALSKAERNTLASPRRKVLEKELLTK